MIKRSLIYQDFFVFKVKEEIEFVHDYFQSSSERSWEERLYEFLFQHKTRFLLHSNVRLMLVFSFIVPIEVNDFILSQYRLYLAKLKKELGALFKKAGKGPTEECTIAYVTLLDGLDVQLVYETRQNYENTMTIAWKVFLAGIRQLNQH